ncbi:MAG: ribosome maturation factor RimP [Clostridia bacterium]
MSKVVDSATLCVEPIVVAHNMELVEVEYRKLYGQDTLTVYIDKVGGITLDDCEEISNAINQPLDDADPTDGAPYNLNVSSPGLDRPYKTQKDFDKHIGDDVEISLYKALNGSKKFEAKLIGFDGELVTVEYKSQIIKLGIKDIAVIRSAIKF